jgi:arylsulfatase A
MKIVLNLKSMWLILAGFMAMQVASGQYAISALPNVVYDLGYGDLACYGQKHFPTPNLDKLAVNGLQLRQHYARNTVCAPSRASLLSGLHAGRCPIRGNKEVDGEGQVPLPDLVFTLAELFKAQG